MKISIIVPIYNVEKYLKRCIDSLTNQVNESENLEILLIDDGSTDNCGIICDDYASRVPYISVFHKENGGLSDARNYGIFRANGDYLIFANVRYIFLENSLNSILKITNKQS